MGELVELSGAEKLAELVELRKARATAEAVLLKLLELEGQYVAEINKSRPAKKKGKT